MDQLVNTRYNFMFIVIYSRQYWQILTVNICVRVRSMVSIYVTLIYVNYIAIIGFVIDKRDLSLTSLLHFMGKYSVEPQ